MAKKKIDDQPDLFSMTQPESVEPPSPRPEQLGTTPTQEAVNALVRRTGESPRKCFFWLVEESKKGKTNV